MTTENTTQTAATTTEGQATSQTAASTTTTAPAADATQAAQQQQAPEGQTTEAKAEGTKTEGEQAKPEGAPEKYEFKAPEGREFDPAVLTPFSEVAKELNLSQGAAQKILDKVAPVIESRQIEQIQALRADWVKQSSSDKEFGGEKFDENLGIAKKARDAFGTPELRTLLNDSGLGDHPEVIRWMYRVGKAISEDRFVAGGNTGASHPQTIAQRMYPNMNP